MVLVFVSCADSSQMAPPARPFKVAGRNLAKIRQQKGLTQEKAAERIGISLKYYQAVEGGFKAPTFLTLCKMRRALSASWEEFFRGC
jgi:transcriptional regulator with XRE-family HTH domain